MHGGGAQILYSSELALPRALFDVEFDPYVGGVGAKFRFQVARAVTHDSLGWVWPYSLSQRDPIDCQESLILYGGAQRFSETKEGLADLVIKVGSTPPAAHERMSKVFKMWQSQHGEAVARLAARGEWRDIHYDVECDQHYVNRVERLSAETVPPQQFEHRRDDDEPPFPDDMYAYEDEAPDLDLEAELAEFREWKRNRGIGGRIRRWWSGL